LFSSTCPSTQGRKCRDAEPRLTANQFLPQDELSVMGATFAIGLQSPDALTVPDIDNGSPGSSIGHNLARHGAPRR
jgi:hypothetical protein